MLWFLGCYVLVAFAFYSYIAMTAQEDPTTATSVNGLTTPVREYAFSNGRETDRHGLRVA